ARHVIDAVKAKLREVEHSMPPGMKIVPTYDRSGLISQSITTLRRTLIEEAIVVSIVIIIFLFHFRSALVPILALPIAVLASFIPVFLLEAQEGRMFRPLALTKTFAMVAASLLSITLVPVLMTIFIRGKRLEPESQNPVSRFFSSLYEPIIRAALRWKWTAL